VRRQLVIPLVIARYDDQFAAVCPNFLADTLKTIAPIFNTAQNAQDHELRAPDRLFRVKINRIGVRKRHQVGEAQARTFRAKPGMCRCKTAKLGISC